MSNPYQRNGFKNRKEYLKHLAEEHGVTLDVVLSLAELLGPEEDFDGLVSMLDDM